MWHCPKCAEQIDDVFDVCWKCGTARDGTAATDFQAEPSDAEASNPGPEPEPRKEIAEDSIAALAKNERIVELCSAASAIEAHALRMLLEEAGIRARVVGDNLGNAAGSLPLGEPTAPRVWVREADAERAREIIEDWTSEPHDEWSDLDEGAEQSEAQEDAVPPSGVGCLWLSEGLLIAAAVCILWGAVWAGYSWMTARKYHETTEGVLVDCESYHSEHDPPPYVIPLPRRQPTFSVRYYAQYAFVVDGETFVSVVHTNVIPGSRVPIHYDPDDLTEKVIVGPLTRPWVVLVSMFGIGALLAIIAYRFRKRATDGRRYDILDGAGAS
jgi:hypothetical protein